MSRPLDSEDLRVWAVVAGTVRPLPGRVPPKAAAPVPERPGVAVASPPPPIPPPKRQASAGPAGSIEPGRRRRLEREREPIAARIDLHGLTHDRARAALAGFLARAQADGWRSALVITGKGYGGDGLLRRLAPEWLAEAPLRALVAGVSQAHRRHGGEGALYVALKKPRG